MTGCSSSKLGDSPGGAQAVVDVAVLVASADGQIDELETEALVEAIRAMTRSDAADARQRLGTSVEAHALSGGPARMRALASALAELRIADECLSLAIAMAYANSGIAPEERAVIEQLGSALGISGEALEESVRSTCARIEHAIA